MIFFSIITHPPTRYLHQRLTLGICFFIQAQNILSWARVTEFVILNSHLFFFLYLVLQAETNNQNNIITFMHVQLYLQLKIKVNNYTHSKAIFHTQNVKQKDDGMDQNTLHYCYDEHMATNQQTKINKTCCHNIASLSCHIIFKDLSKFIICRWISLRLGKVS